MRQRGPWWLTSATLYVAHIVQKLYKHFFFAGGASWSWSHGSWIYSYLCNQYLSPLKLWVQTMFPPPIKLTAMI